MRIDNRISGGVGPQGAKGGVAPPDVASKGAGTSGASDVFSLSSAAQVATLRNKLADVPPVRDSKVEAIQSQLGSNSYRPDGDAVAAGLINHHMSPKSF
jgi:flagellar biosynthesis anti-sigma factor FlgM